MPRECLTYYTGSSLLRTALKVEDRSIMRSFQKSFDKILHLTAEVSYVELWRFTRRTGQITVQITYTGMILTDLHHLYDEYKVPRGWLQDLSDLYLVCTCFRFSDLQVHVIVRVPGFESTLYSDLVRSV